MFVRSFQRFLHFRTSTKHVMKKFLKNENMKISWSIRFVLLWRIFHIHSNDFVLDHIQCAFCSMCLDFSLLDSKIDPLTSDVQWIILYSLGHNRCVIVDIVDLSFAISSALRPNAFSIEEKSLTIDEKQRFLCFNTNFVCSSANWLYRRSKSCLSRVTAWRRFL